MRPRFDGLIALLMVVFLIAACTSSDDTADDATSEAPATTVAPAATVAATAPATTALVTPEAGPGDGVIASFDGTTCTYQGPEEVSPTAPFTVSFTNESDVTAALSILGYEGEDFEELRSLIGQDREFLPPVGGVLGGASLEAEPGESTTQNALLEQRTWIVNCHTFEPGVHGPAHIWYIGIIESK